MLYEVYGDVIEDKTYDVFCHQTNCQGVMGAGVALQVKIKYPEVAKCDREYFLSKREQDHAGMLGTNVYIMTNDGRTCVNMYAQFHYRNDGTRKTDYIAFKRCLIRLINKLQTMDPSLKVAFPYGIGCGLGGGDWNVIKAMISSFSEHVEQDVYLVRLKPNS